MKMERNISKEEIIRAARKAIADKQAWMKTVEIGGSIQQLRKDGVKIVKLD